MLNGAKCFRTNPVNELYINCFKFDEILGSSYNLQGNQDLTLKVDNIEIKYVSSLFSISIIGCSLFSISIIGCSLFSIALVDTCSYSILVLPHVVTEFRCFSQVCQFLNTVCFKSENESLHNK